VNDPKRVLATKRREKAERALVRDKGSRARRLDYVRARMAELHQEASELCEELRKLAVWAEDNEVYTDDAWNMNEHLDRFQDGLNDWAPFPEEA
jgi:hypothetical protein